VKKWALYGGGLFGCLLFLAAQEMYAQLPIVLHDSTDLSKFSDLRPHIQAYKGSFKDSLGYQDVLPGPWQRMGTGPMISLRSDDKYSNRIRFAIRNSHAGDTLKLLLNAAHHDLLLFSVASLLRFSAASIRHDAGVWLVGSGPGVYQSLNELVRGMPLTDGGLLHFGYMCMLLGLCLFLGLFALVQGLYNRDATYTYWAVYLWANFLFYGAAIDFIFQFGLLGNHHQTWTSVVQYVVQLAYLLFLGSFLDIRQNHPPTHRLIKMLIGVILPAMSFAWYAVGSAKATSSRYLIDYADAFSFVTVLFNLVIFLRIARVGIPQSRLIIVGSLGVLAMAILAGVVDQSNLSRIGAFRLDPMVIFSVGFLFELTFFTLALSQRTQQVQEENRRLQQDYTQRLEQSLAMRVATIQAQNQLLEDERLQRLTNEFDQRIAQTEMAALRSQMNPHFIFNCLNSIQFFTAQNDAEKASAYLTKFSRLIRLVLENSKSERVTLANELETLRLYIEMEAMRFQQKVHYAIEVADSIDTDSIQMPPLLLQPFVENAIWHGLMHKEEGGTVRIVVQQPTEHLLHVEITDDGVGRQKAAEYKSKSATRSKSFGMKMTSERIELINQLYHTQTQVAIIDLVDVQGQAAGTKIVVEIPV